MKPLYLNPRPISYRYIHILSYRSYASLYISRYPEQRAYVYSYAPRHLRALYIAIRIYLNQRYPYSLRAIPHNAALHLRFRLRYNSGRFLLQRYRRYLYLLTVYIQNPIHPYKRGPLECARIAPVYHPLPHRLYLVYGAHR